MIKNLLKLLEEELKDTKDKLLRALAENENTRKQMDKTRQEGIKYGVQPLAREIINIVDNFDRALNTKSELNEKAPITESVDKKVNKTIDSSKSNLNESTAYVDPQINKIKDLMNRINS
mgnify:CR=1 FL=1